MQQPVDLGQQQRPAGAVAGPVVGGQAGLDRAGDPNAAVDHHHPIAGSAESDDGHLRRVDHAQDALGDVVFVELPEVGRQLSAGKAFGVVESVKAVSDLYAPLDGEVVDVQGNAGEWMQVGAPLAHVVRTDKLRVEGYVDAAKWDAEQVRGRPVTVVVSLANGRQETFEGRISFVSPLVESGGDYRVFAEVANRRSAGSGEWLLRAGQTATMTIHSDRPASP